MLDSVVDAAAGNMDLMTSLGSSSAFSPGRDTDPGGGSRENLGPEHGIKLRELIGDLPQDLPDVENTARYGGSVWVLLFGFAMVTAIGVNLALMVAFRLSRALQRLRQRPMMTMSTSTTFPDNSFSVFRVPGGKKGQRLDSDVVHMIHVFLFLVNLSEYGFLVFEFTLGIEHQFPYAWPACAAYQVVTKCGPILEAMTVVALLYYVSTFHGNTSDRTIQIKSEEVTCIAAGSSPGRIGVTGGTSIPHHGQGKNATTGTTPSSFRTFVAIMVIPLTLVALFGMPVAHFASLVKVGEGDYCEIEIASSPWITSSKTEQQAAISAFYLAYSSILCYFLPLLVAIHPLVKIIRSHRRRQRRQEPWTVCIIALSFFSMYFFHAAVVTVRHFHDLLGVQLTATELWRIKVLQSLAWLVAYFWHSTRPALVLVLDQELKYCLSTTWLGFNDYSFLPMVNRGDEGQGLQGLRHLLPRKILTSTAPDLLPCNWSARPGKNSNVARVDLTS